MKKEMYKFIDGEVRRIINTASQNSKLVDRPIFTVDINKDVQYEVSSYLNEFEQICIEICVSSWVNEEDSVSTSSRSWTLEKESYMIPYNHFYNLTTAIDIEYVMYLLTFIVTTIARHLQWNFVFHCEGIPTILCDKDGTTKHIYII